MHAYQDAVAREEGKLRASGNPDVRSMSMAKRRAQFGEVSKDLNSIFYEFPFTVPEYFALITRALIVLEGIAITGDRDFDIFRASYPYAAKHAAQLITDEWASFVTFYEKARALAVAGAAAI